MSLKIVHNPDGSLKSKWWYGVIEVDGRRKVVSLGVPIKGRRIPQSLKDQGDEAFEASRIRAQAKLVDISEQALTKKSARSLVERFYEMQTGESIASIKVSDLPRVWTKLPRSNRPNPRYMEQCVSTLKRFSTFMAAHYPAVTNLVQTTTTMARAFMDHEAARDISPKTWNDTLKLLRGAFKNAQPETGAISNPFTHIPTRTAETIFRKPYSPEELNDILHASLNDPFIRPILITGMCTAMRRGDCCLLKWADVDLATRFITVKTAKTGATVAIPIFPILFDELASRKKTTSEFVFPEQAAMYQENPDGITWRVKRVLAGVFHKAQDNTASQLTPEEIRTQVSTHLASLAETPKNSRMKKVVADYLAGIPSKELLKSHDISKGSLSGYLKEIEEKTGCIIPRGGRTSNHVTSPADSDNNSLQTARKNGRRRASVRDFHSFRVTWVTLALTAGVPLELVQRVTGHKTTDIVLKHYFQPGREAFRDALQRAMPQLLTQHTGKTLREELVEEIKTAKIPKAKREALLALAARVTT